MNHQGTEVFQGWLGSVLVGVTSLWEVQGGVLDGSVYRCLVTGAAPETCFVKREQCVVPLGTNTLIPS